MRVKTANDGADGISFFQMYEPDLVLPRHNAPEKDGWQVCREIREISSKPIIMITAKGDVFDKVLGLELGADDFVVKPFDMKEISARVKAVLRRYTAHEDQSDDGVIEFDNIETVSRNTSSSSKESRSRYLRRSFSSLFPRVEFQPCIYPRSAPRQGLGIPIISEIHERSTYISRDFVKSLRAYRTNGR